MSKMGLGKAEDLTGRVFGRLTVTGFVGKDRHGGVLWDCRCSCGSDVRAVHAGNLRRGRTTSCGCRKREALIDRNTTHGMSHRPEFFVWQKMRARCSNKNSTGWQRYGGREIKVCEEWDNSFEAFLADMGARPSPDHSIERRDNDANYEPSNCVWATDIEQANNKSNNVLLTYLGETKTMAQWCRALHLNPDVVWYRTKQGWSDEDALTKPVREMVKTDAMTHLGETRTIAQWCKEFGLDYTTVSKRKKLGWSDEDALTKPVRRYTQKQP